MAEFSTRIRILCFWFESSKGCTDGKLCFLKLITAIDVYTYTPIRITLLVNMPMALRADLCLRGRKVGENTMAPLSPPRKASRFYRNSGGLARASTKFDSADVDTPGEPMSPSDDDIVLG
jgi:hypothetical protein